MNDYQEVATREHSLLPLQTQFGDWDIQNSAKGGEWLHVVTKAFLMSRDQAHPWNRIVRHGVWTIIYNCAGIVSLASALLLIFVNWGSRTQEKIYTCNYNLKGGQTPTSLEGGFHFYGGTFTQSMCFIVLLFVFTAQLAYLFCCAVLCVWLSCSQEFLYIYCIHV